jgi:hypothetical protein
MNHATPNARTAPSHTADAVRTKSAERPAEQEHETDERHALLRLQHTHGNRFVQRMLRAGSVQRQCACGRATVGGGECAACRLKRLQRKAAASTEALPDAGRSPVPGSAIIGPADDELERAADEVAAAVPTQSPGSLDHGPVPQAVQRGTKAAPPAGAGSAARTVADVPDAGPGAPLDPRTRAFMESHLGHDFGGVRVHAGGAAAQSAEAIDARAYTAGHDVVFADGEYRPGTHDGDRLLAHELTHVVQQTGATLRAPAVQRKGNEGQENPGGVALPMVEQVIISCADQRIVFQTAQVNYSYTLNADPGCDLDEGEYLAGVSVTGDRVKFQLPADVGPGVRFRFGFSINPGQKNPAKLFKNQPTVSITATNKSIAELREREPEQVAPPEPEHAPSSRDWEYEAFKRLVRNAAKARLTANHASLEKWRAFLRTKITPGQLHDQAMAEEMRRLALVAQQRGNLYQFEEYGKTRNPVMREYKEGVMTGTICPSCHGILRAEAFEKGLGETEKTGPLWTAPADRLRQIEARETANPTARPDFSTQDKPVKEWAAVQKSEHPTVRGMASSIDRIRPFLAPLGPKGYQVLPEHLMESTMEGPELLAQVYRLIDAREAGYAELTRKIDDPDFDYMMLRPIVRDLLPLANEYVQARVEADIRAAEEWEKIKSILMAGVMIFLILMAIFPPTSAIGVAGVALLEAGTAAYAVYSGIEMVEMGRTLSMGRGATDVFDPEQVDAAGAMMAMGVFTIAMGLFGLKGAAARGVKLLRATRGGAAIVEGVEGQAGGMKIEVTKLDSVDPHVKLTGPDGKVIFEGPLSKAPKTAATGIAEESFEDVAEALKKVPEGQGPPVGTQAEPIRPPQPGELPPIGQGTAPGAPAFQESAGAANRGSTFQSASAQTSRSLKTAIQADIGEAEAYKAALARGEIGLQRPAGANVQGGDFFTAVRKPDGTMEIVATDVKTTTVGKFPKPKTTLKGSWRAEAKAAVAEGRLQLGDEALEKEIREAFDRGVRLRQVNANYSPSGQGTITGF